MTHITNASSRTHLRGAFCVLKSLAQKIRHSGGPLMLNVMPFMTLRKNEPKRTGKEAISDFSGTVERKRLHLFY